MARYPFPWDLFIGLALDLPKGYRSFAHDTAEMTRRMQPAPCVAGEEHIPPSGPVALAANHYQRRGLWIAWPGAVITTAVWERRSQEPPVHWLVTGGLRLFQWRGSGPEILPARRLFDAVARAYGMAALPLTGASRRGRVLRRWIGWAEGGEVIGIFPEGLAGTSDHLRSPEPGFAVVCNLLKRRGIPIVPCGIWEKDGALHVTFGRPIMPEAAGSETVMHAVAALLPERQRGEYAAGIQGHEPDIHAAGLSAASGREEAGQDGPLE